MTSPDLPCNRFVVLVTDYLDGALDPDLVLLVDHHLTLCHGCSEVLSQWRRTISLTGALTVDEVEACDPVVRAELVAAFTVTG